jgi:Sec-independent protein translocase protein TatA
MQDRIGSRRQAGLGLISLIFIGLIIVALLIIGAKQVPAITEYLAIEKAIKQIRIEASTVPELRKAFDRYAVIDDIKSISAKDLDITKESDKIVISYAYTYQIPIADNVRLVIDFAGTTSGRPKAD